MGPKINENKNTSEYINTFF